MIDALKAERVEGATVLDIGGGIGVNAVALKRLKLPRRESTSAEAV